MPHLPVSNVYVIVGCKVTRYRVRTTKGHAMTTDYLFARPSFLRGMARVADLGARLDRGAYNVSRTAAQADARALQSDWHMVVDDFASAFDETFSHIDEAFDVREGEAQAS